jgi:hypothetical protein
VADVPVGAANIGADNSALPIVDPGFSVARLDATTPVLSELNVNTLMRASKWLVRRSERDLVVDTGNSIIPWRPFGGALPAGRSRQASHRRGDVRSLRPCRRPARVRRAFGHEAEITQLRHLVDARTLLAWSRP